MSDFNKAKLIIEKINNESSLKGIETIIDELSESINYFDNTKVSKNPQWNEIKQELKVEDN